VGPKDVSDAAIEAFDHAIGLRAAGLGQAMLDAVVGTDPIVRYGCRWVGVRRWHRSGR